MVHEKTECILTAARKVFFSYGYRKVTMGDIAEAAHISRPALYLVFTSKEQIFKEVISRLIAESLDEIRTGIPKLKTTAAKLTFAFEVWIVRPHALIHTAPDASDFLECSYEFASQMISDAGNEFEEILVEILEPLVSKQSAIRLSTPKITRVLANSVYGMKKMATSSTELRQMIDDLLTITMTSLRLKGRT